MISLLRTAWKERYNRILIVFSLVSMLLLTFASQLEIFSIGIMTKKGPDFFELFAEQKNGVLVPNGEVTKTTLLERFDALDMTNTGVVTLAETQSFLAKEGKRDILDRALDIINPILPVSGNVRYLVILIIFVALFKAITMFFYRFYTKVIAINISRNLRAEFFEHIQTLPMSFFHKYNMGALSSRIVTDASSIAEAVNASLTNYVQTPFTVVSTLVLCFMTSWQLSLLIFLGFPLIVGPILFIAARVKRLAKQLQTNQERFTTVILDFLGGILTVKAFGMEAFSLKKYREENDRMASLERRSARYDLSSRPVVHTIAMGFLAAALLFGLYGLEMNLSETLVYCGLLYVFYEPFKKFAEENARIQRGIAAMERMQEVMSEHPIITDALDALPKVELSQEIAFRDVSFSYLPGIPVLSNLSFTIKKGETVALVGPTGSGKTTLVQLLLRLYDIQSGSIEIDNRPIEAYARSALREAIAFVPQRPFLFIDTIAANIAYGRPYSEEEIKKAAKRAHADEFINRLSRGYETEVQDGGKNLSGGQQQRVAIARALIKQAPILILDEATSSLDTVSERLIKEAIDHLRGEVTQIIIAHRLSTIEHADKILYLEQGRIVAEGTKEQLLISCPGFRTMWELSRFQ